MRTAHSESEPSSPTSVQFLQGILRFARVARYRWLLLATVVLSVLFLGTLYYATVDRVYEARAQLLVQQTGPIVTSTGTADGVMQQGMLPTYERLFVSTVVLEGAIQRLQQLPREMRVDLINCSREQWIGKLRSHITVRSLRLTNVLEISYRSQSPLAAEAVVQSLVDSYMQFMKSNHETVAEELVTILRSERQDVEQQLRLKEQELIAAKRKFGDLGLREASQTLHPLVQRVIRINESLIEVQANRLKIQATLAAVDEARTSGADLRQHLMAVEPVIGREVVLAALGLSEQDEQTVARLERQLIEDRAELESLATHYGDRHPKVVRLGDAIQETRAYLANYQQEVDRRSENLQNRQLATMLPKLLTQELSKAQAQETFLTQQYDRAQTEAVALQGRFEEIAMLQREVDRLVNFNHTLLDHINSIDINQNQSDVRVEVVSRPQAGKQPVAPNAFVTFTLCFFLGISAGAALVYVVDLMDDRFRSLDEMKLQLQTPVLAMIRQLIPHQETGLDALQVHVAPDAVESEAFRTLRTTIAFAGEELECVAVSSSEPGDGKTTVAANLGLSFAQAGRRTLLIDADLRRPGLTRLFELKGRLGLAELLRDDQHLATMVSHSIYRVASEGLDVLPSGTRPLDPTGLLGSARFADLLAWATAHYDQVLIDSPPMLVASDAAVVGRMAGGLMLVVQPQKNHRRLVVRAIEEARSVGLNLIGIILNRLTQETQHSYYGDGYGYGYGYGASYGESVEVTDKIDDRRVADASQIPRRAA